jgi:hypothetical protein
MRGQSIWESSMASLAIEVEEEEVACFDRAKIECKTIRGNNYDGDLVTTIIVSLTSAQTVKAICDVIKEIIKQRRSGKIKLNGLEVSNVSEDVLLKLAEQKLQKGTNDVRKGKR